jgi:histone H3/H4
MSSVNFDSVISPSAVKSSSAGAKAKADSFTTVKKAAKPKKTKATSDKPALAVVTTGLKKHEAPSVKHKLAKTARMQRYEQFPLSALSKPKLKRMALSHGIRMLSADGYAALRAVAEENALNIIGTAMTMTGSSGRRIVNEKDVKYALDLNRQ